MKQVAVMTDSNSGLPRNRQRIWACLCCPCPSLSMAILIMRTWTLRRKILCKTASGAFHHHLTAFTGTAFIHVGHAFTGLRGVDAVLYYPDQLSNSYPKRAVVFRTIRRARTGGGWRAHFRHPMDGRTGCAVVG